MTTGDSVTDTCARQVARECFALRVQALSRVVSRLYDEALRPLGLTTNQMSILTVLANMGTAPPRAVGAYLHMEKSTVSRTVKRMREQKWVREEPGADARSVRLALTEKGRALLVRAVPLWERAQARARELLGGEQTGRAAIAALSELIDRFIMPAGKR
jgi:DNA-binding MarR family transcriptional regulator